MICNGPFRPGITTLVEEHSHLLRGLRVGLVSNQSAVDCAGVGSAEVLRDHLGGRLRALFGPEHGFFGTETAGQSIPNTRHPIWRIPVHSLYGKTRSPTPPMLRGLDAMVFDLPDIGARPYTYASTLRNVLEAAAQAGLRVVVADRPIPLPCAPDGPLLDQRFMSFVAAIPAPMCYAMTPGETALYLKSALGLKLDLKVAPMRGYRRGQRPGPDWPPWIPPSPGIRSWESAACYLSTVFTEALPAVDCGRSSILPFQLVGAPGLNSAKLIAEIEKIGLVGAHLHPHRYAPATGPFASRVIDGARIIVNDYQVFRPVSAGIVILWAIQRLIGAGGLWSARGTREEWFDKLYGTDTVRLSLKAGAGPDEIRVAWAPGLRRFASERRPCLLY